MARKKKPTAEMKQAFDEFVAEIPALLRELQGLLLLSGSYLHVAVAFDDDSLSQVESFYLDVLARKERIDVSRERLDRCYEAYIGEAHRARAGGGWVLGRDDFTFGTPSIAREGRITVSPARMRRLQCEDREPFLCEWIDYAVNQEKYQDELFKEDDK